VAAPAPNEAPTREPASDIWESVKPLISLTDQFVPLLYAHIQKENNILYPMAQRTISPEQFELLHQSCEAFDEEIRGKINVAELKQLATSLALRYPADSASLAVYGGCGACPSHA
jgi:hemerythrin-like domain-containing protein